MVPERWESIMAGKCGSRAGGRGQEERQAWWQEQRVEGSHPEPQGGRTESELEMALSFENPPLVTYFLKEGHMTQTSHKQHRQLGTKYSNARDLKGGIYYSNHHSAPESPLGRGKEIEVWRRRGSVAAVGPAPWSFLDSILATLEEDGLRREESFGKGNCWRWSQPRTISTERSQQL